MKLALILLFAASTFAQAKKPKQPLACQKHGHFSEPVIIDNPAAILDLVDATEEAELQPVTPDGRAWKVACKDPMSFLRIYWTSGNTDNATPQALPLMAGKPVTIEFRDDKQKKKAGSMKIESSAGRGDLKLQSVDAGAGPELRWKKPTPGQVKAGRAVLNARGQEDYRVETVRYWPAGATAETEWSAQNKGFSKVVVVLCTNVTPTNAEGKYCRQRPRTPQSTKELQ